MKHNPFTSRIYQETWLRHFAKQSEGKQFQFIENLLFIKHKFLPYYINAGRNMTNGVTYEIDTSQLDFKNKTFLIYDVPDYCDTSKISENSTLRIKKVRQYKGFLANLSQFTSFEDYLKNTLHAKSRNKFRSTLKKFESCFNVSYNYYYGDIEKDIYKTVMTNFRNLVESRYGDLKIETNLISEWPFYEEIVYKMFHEKKALIISIEVDGEPISMSLAFLSENTLIGAVKAFNTNYYKFNVGHIEISKLITWCIENNKHIMDFSKGEYEYKTKWTNTNYLYNCHVVYDKSSLTSNITGRLLVKYFELKQYLRDKNFNLFVAKTRYAIKNIGSSNEQKLPFKIHPITSDLDVTDYKLISLKDEVENSPFLKRIVLDSLFQSPESFSEIKIYKSHEKAGSKPLFGVIGTKRKYIIEIL